MPDSGGLQVPKLTIGMACIALAVGGSCLGQEIRQMPAGPDLFWQFEEQKLCPLPDTDKIDRPLASPDEMRFAYVESREAGQVVVADCKVGPLFEQIVLLRYSADSQHLYYLAEKGGKDVLVVDGQTVAEAKTIQMPVFSDDGKRLAYVLGESPRERVVVDGQALAGEFGELSAIQFTPDNKRLLFIARDPVSRTDSLYVDGQPQADIGTTYAGVAVSPDGRRMAWSLLRKDSQQAVALDGQVGPGFSDVGNLSFSPDSKHFAYTYQKDRRGAWGLMLDGRPVAGKYGDIAAFRFSPNSRKYAFISSAEPEGQAVVVGEQAGPLFPQVFGPLIFSADSKRLAYVAKRSSGYAMIVDGLMTMPSEFRSIDARYAEGDAERGVCDEIKAAAFSADGRHLAYKASQNGYGGEHLIINHQAGPRYRWLSNNPPRIAADGSVEYLAIKPDGLYRVTRSPVPDPRPGLADLAANTKVPRTPESRLLAKEIMAGINREYGLLYKDPTIQAFKAVGTVREGQNDIGRLTIIGERTNWGLKPELESNLSADQKGYLMPIIQIGFELTSWLKSYPDNDLYAVDTGLVYLVDCVDQSSDRERIERAHLVVAKDLRVLGSFVRMKDGLDIEQSYSARRADSSYYTDAATMVYRAGGNQMHRLDFGYTYQMTNGQYFIENLNIRDIDAAGTVTDDLVSIERVEYTVKKP
jgi:Tol biopolymer transport system component